MATVSESKACRSCAATKRRCGKQTPRCLRCRTRGTECIYPATKPASFVLCREETPTHVPSLESRPFSGSNLQLSLHGARDAHLLSGLFGLEFSGLPQPSSSLLTDDQIASSWFASLDTWQVRLPITSQTSSSIPDFKRFITRILQWLADWVEKGSNPFIHVCLYRTRFPRCIQDAYTTLSCYFHRTAANEQVTFRIIEDRMKNLLAEYSAPSPSGNTTTTDSTHLDPFDHVARVHALLVYQILGLYDGDIRLRHLSETCIPVLNSWMQEMVQQASHDAYIGGYITSSAQEQMGDVFSAGYSSQRENLLWHSWILAESARRAWLMGSGIQVVFLALQQRDDIPCQGGMMVTTRQGIWEAQSAVSWEKICSEVHVGLMQMAEAERLFTEFGPNDVNDFTKAALEAVFGQDRMERWGVGSEELKL